MRTTARSKTSSARIEIQPEERSSAASLRPDSHTVVVVDDDDATCDTFAAILQTRGYRVSTFRSAHDYLSVAELRPDCLIADVRMPDIDGVSMFEAARAAGREAPTVFVTGVVDVSAAVAAMRAGACDVLAKPVKISTLLAAVESAVSSSAARRTANDVLAGQWRAIGGLTSREAQVCALVARGRLNKQIAATIGTTEKTVKVHRARALQKLGVNSVAGLVHMLDAVLGAGADEHPVDARDRPLQRPITLDIIAKYFVED
jgi:FixJ family two-component response regulator